MAIVLKVSAIGTSTLVTTTISQGQDAKCHPPRYGIFGVKHTNIVVGASSTQSVNVGMNIWAKSRNINIITMSIR
jgi:hypothetical protein